MNIAPVMLDIETLGTAPSSAIVSIGAVRFSWKDGAVSDKFYINVDAADCVRLGLKIDPDTIQWWSTQPKEARQAWMKDPVSVHEALSTFNEWFGKGKPEVWCNGMNFDFPLLETAFRAVELKSPWQYYLLNDMRTIVNMFNARDKYRVWRQNDAESVYHNALDDCIAQAKFLSQMIGEIKLQGI